AYAVAGLSAKMVVAVPPNTTPLVPLGVVISNGSSGSSSFALGAQCGLDVLLTYHPSGSSDVPRIVPLRLSPSDIRPTDEEAYISKGYLGGGLRAKSAYPEFVSTPPPNVAMAINQRWGGQTPDTDLRLGINYDTRTGYNNSEPRLG